jgi:hypothetical protein
MRAPFNPSPNLGGEEMAIGGHPQTLGRDESLLRRLRFDTLRLPAGGFLHLCGVLQDPRQRGFAPLHILADCTRQRVLLGGRGLG